MAAPPAEEVPPSTTAPTTDIPDIASKTPQYVFETAYILPSFPLTPGTHLLRPTTQEVPPPPAQVPTEPARVPSTPPAGPTISETPASLPEGRLTPAELEQRTTCVSILAHLSQAARGSSSSFC